MIRRAARWDTKFGRWVHTYGARRLARELHITVGGVYEYVAARSLPRPQLVVQIERLSGGQVRFEDLYAHRETLQTQR